MIDAIAALPHDTHPMTVLMTGMATLGAYHPDANPALAGGGVYDDPSVRSEMVLRVLGAAPTLAAIAYHKRNGSMATPPNETLGGTLACHARTLRPLPRTAGTLKPAWPARRVRGELPLHAGRPG